MPTSTSGYDVEQFRSFRGRARAMLKRLAHVATVLGRFGLAWVLAELELLPRPLRARADTAMMALELPERLRLALEELGPTAIKLGQVLASRGDVIPPAYVGELRKLREDVPPAEFEAIEALIAQELGADIGDLFEEFEPTPRASASIGQVHFARLKGGQPVAVKVQRPGVAAAVEIDLHLLLYAARRAEKVLSWAADNHVQEFVQEFVRTLREELDFLIEAHNTDRLRANLKDDEQAHVPAIVWTLTSRRVLVIEWVEGARVGDEASLERFKVDREAAASNLLRLMMHQILTDGYFHGDPHGGNVLFLGGDRIAFLDCGNAVAIDRNTRDGLVAVLLGVLSDDPQEVCDYLLAMGAASERTDAQRLTNDIGRMMAHYQGFRSTADVSLGTLLDDLLGVVLRHGVRMQPAFAAIAKSLMVTEGVCLELAPDLDVQGVARGEGRRILLDRFAPRRLGDDMLRLVRTLQRYAQLLPRQASQVLARAQTGGLKLRVSHENLERPLKRLDLMINRIVFAIVVSAIIGSSTNLLRGGTVSGTVGEWLTYGYLSIGVLLGGWLLFSILRSGRL